MFPQPFCIDTTMNEESSISPIRSAASEGVTADPSRPARPFQLISRRLPNVYNSSGRDIEALQRGKTWNPAFLHPEDLAMLGLHDGDLVEIASDHAAIVGVAEASDDVPHGVISMAHSWGDAPEHDARVREIGGATNRLVANDRDFDPISGMARQSAIPVNVRRLAEAR